MSRVLYIIADPKPVSVSRTLKISEAFILTHKQFYPDDEIVTLDLYKENIRFLTNDDLQTIFAPKSSESRYHPILKYAYQFAEADKYVIAEPMWNLNIPAILKAYIDYITISGITFKYTEQGAVGLLKGKKALNIITRGGDYFSESHRSLEMGDRYMRVLFAFFGISDFTTINADRLDIIGENIDGILNTTIARAQNLAKEF